MCLGLPACVENQLLKLVMDPKEGIECKGFARHDAKGDLVPFKFLRRLRPQLTRSAYCPSTKVVAMGQSFETTFLEPDFLKASDKAFWKFLCWTRGNKIANLLIGLKKLNTFMVDGFLGNAGTRGQMMSSSESHIVGSAMRISSGLTIGMGTSNILLFLGE